jgi:limonene-1,2-epoxide hydrolase
MSKQTWRDHCLPDFVWWNAGRGAVNGLEAACKKIEGMHEHLHFSHLKVPIRHFVSTGTTVIVERVDELYSEDGTLLWAIPVVGVVEFEGEKIREWRDYCDDWVLKEQLKKQK